MTLQEKTEDAMVEHTVEINKYGKSFQKQKIKQFSNLLIDIRNALLEGDEFVSVGDLRKMQSQAKALFKQGVREIYGDITIDLEYLLELDIEGQVKLLQELADEYDVPYDYREPSLRLAKRSFKDLPIEDLTFEAWFNLWGSKTSERMTSGLFSEYTGPNGEKSREEIVYDVFGKKDPFTTDTFRRAGTDMDALLISAVDGINSTSSSSVAGANPGVVVGVVWNSCLCSTTCPRCASLHGSERYYNGKDETDGNEIPLHPNCMCFWTYIYQDAKKMSVKVPSEGVSDVNSSPTPKKFNVWYNSISKDRKIDLFGKARYKMLESGDITVSKLLTKENRRLYTLDELRNKGYRVPKK